MSGAAADGTGITGIACIQALWGNKFGDALAEVHWFYTPEEVGWTGEHEDMEVSLTHVTRHTSHVTRHTSHVTRHTSHVTRHTSHVTPNSLSSSSTALLLMS